MNDTELERLAAEKSATASYRLEMYFTAGQLTEKQRRDIAAVMQRVCTGLATQIGMIADDKFSIDLFYDSSTARNLQLDIE